MESNLTIEEIYNILENEIAQLEVLPGDILSENSLCRRFHISRTPIRSVLQRLQQNGFVQIVPYKGTIVTPIHFKLASQWIFQRLAVEWFYGILLPSVRRWILLRCIIFRGCCRKSRKGFTGNPSILI